MPTWCCDPSRNQCNNTLYITMARGAAIEVDHLNPEYEPTHGLFSVLFLIPPYTIGSPMRCRHRETIDHPFHPSSVPRRWLVICLPLRLPVCCVVICNAVKWIRWWLLLRQQQQHHHCCCCCCVAAWLFQSGLTRDPLCGATACDMQALM